MAEDSGAQIPGIFLHYLTEPAPSSSLKLHGTTVKEHAENSSYHRTICREVGYVEKKNYARFVSNLRHARLLYHFV